jgi:predicted glycogen debranching enzyme
MPVHAAPAPVSPTVLEEPFIAFGREVCGDLAAASRREWLVANGLGSYASGTVGGVNTRRYHGLLVAALQPPAGRTVTVAELDEWAVLDGTRYPLSTHEWADGTIAPTGYRQLQSFALNGLLPVWTYAVADLLLEKRIWMEQGRHATYASYRVVRGNRPVVLDVTPFCTYRGFHSLTRGGWRPSIEVAARAAAIGAWQGAHRYTLAADAGEFIPADGGALWYWNFRRRVETERGLDDYEDLFAPGTFRATLWPGRTWTLMITVDEPAPNGPIVGEHRRKPLVALAGERVRQAALLKRAGVESQPRFIQQLTLAADQFVVERRPCEGVPGRTVIAGYHWFGDWGRDTMISLPGLMLATGRAADAADVLRTVARYLSEGLLPNRFPDAGEQPEYNTADATLWFFLAVRAYHLAAGDAALVDELLPALRDVIAWHMRGTRHGIKVDVADGLLHCGEPGVQLTWMDAKVGDWVVTPRTGKPVEINALWHTALRIVAEVCAERDPAAAAAYTALADRAAAGFRARFWRPELGYLADVVDTPEGADDLSLRPNQIFAVSLPFPLLNDEQTRSVVDAVGKALLTSYGLRSLAPSDPRYQGHYGGGVAQRDGAYHQGAVWAWLLGPYAEAYYSVYRDAEAARALLRPLADHVQDAGLGSVSEIFDGDPPHTPRGCIAQAWSVAEVLRVWQSISSER